MKVVNCPESCIGCEHAEPHEYDSCDSSCDGGGEYNCPPCEEIIINTLSQPKKEGE